MNLLTKSYFLALFLSFVTSVLSNPCNDDSFFVFGSFRYEGQDIVRTCAWLTENKEAEQKRKNKWCTHQWGHVKVEDKCPSTCGIPRCRSAITQQCVMDYPRNWSDSDGLDCGWYTRGQSNCELFGNGYENLGNTANNACCTCGGGCKDQLDSTWHDSTGFDCSWYAENTARCSDRSADRFRNQEGLTANEAGLIANEACCACGGGEQIRPPQ